MNEEDFYKEQLAESIFNSIMSLIKEDEWNTKSSSYSDNKESVELLVEQLDTFIENNSNSWIGYFIKSNILLDSKDFQKALEIINQGIEKNNALELHYQKAKILEGIDVNQAIETYLYLMQIDNNTYSCVQACYLINQIDQTVVYCNLYFDYHPTTIDNIKSAFAVFALLLVEYHKKPFKDFFTLIDKIDLEKLKNNITPNTAEEAFYNIWKLAKAKNVHKALSIYNQLFADVNILKEGTHWNTPKYPLYGMNHYRYAIYEHTRNEFDIQQVLPKYNEFETFLKIKDNCIKQVRGAFLHFDRWGIAGYIKLVKQKEEWHVSIYQHTDRWYTAYENIYIAINLLAPYVEDAIFFISEDYNVWIDEYNIQNGKLYFERNYAEEEYRDAKLKIIEQKALNRPELNHFISMEHLSDSYIWFYEDEDDFFNKLLGKDKFTSEEAKNAKEAIEKALHYSPQNEQAWLQKGIIYQLSNKNEQAIQYFEKSLSIKKNISVLLILSVEYFNQQQYHKAIAYIDQLINANANLNISYVLKAYSYLMLKEDSKINECFENAIKLTVKNISKPIKNASIESYLQKVKEYHLILNKYLDYVDKKLKKTSSIDKNIKDSLSMQCITWAKWLWDKKKKSSQKIAFEFFNKALLYDPQNIKVYIDQAQLLKRVKNTKEAKKILEEGLKFIPENPEIIAALRDISIENKDYDGAIQYGLKYINIIGENATGYGNQSHILYGYLANAYYEKANELLYKKNQYKEAEDMYDKLLDLYPKLSTEWKKFEGPWIGKSAAQSYQKNHKQALEYANEAVAINNRSAYAWSAKGSCLNNLGKYEEALSCCDEAIKWKSDYYHPWYVKGCIYALTNRPKEAIEMLKKALEIDSTKKEQIGRESDFKSLYTNKDFQELLK